MSRQKYIRKTHEIADIAYMAGIVDGEGSITIGNYSSNKKTGILHYQTILGITNTSKDLLDWIHKTFGGNVWKYSAKQTPKNSRQECYRWVATGDLLTHICELIHPFVICKKKQVEIMLAMRATYTKESTKGGIQGFLSLDQDILDFRQKCFYDLRALHTRKGSLS